MQNSHINEYQNMYNNRIILISCFQHEISLHAWVLIKWGRRQSCWLFPLMHHRGILKHSLTEATAGGARIVKRPNYKASSADGRNKHGTNSNFALAINSYIFLKTWEFPRKTILLKESGPIASDFFFQNFPRFWYQKKAHIFLSTPGEFWSWKNVLFGRY